MIDVHSHILPGIDDGARTILESVEIVRRMSECGVTDMIATPHYVDESVFVSPRAKNAKLLVKLKDELAREGINVNVHLGNEIYINRRIIDLLKSGEVASLARSQYLLVELPLDDEYPNYEDVLLDLMECGGKVVLAHPERYAILQQDYKIAQRLHEEGVLFQCNMGSIAGKYGGKAKKVVRKLAKDKMIFAFGTDVHRPGHYDYLTLAKKKLTKYYNEDELKQVLVKNPSKILTQA